ncbi:hypothetical protein [Streptomyces atratus]|uniref:hypothetical protein n=1 Tax=Streptomyces atratus TaxID=1893 RepID=UPI001E4D78F8|nr:hypothetical protein [Streptomyces atratus]
MAEDVMAGLPPAAARAAVQDLLVEAAKHPDRWPAPGGEEVVDEFGARCWISYVVYRDGLEVRDIGWVD